MRRRPFEYDPPNVAPPNLDPQNLDPPNLDPPSSPSVASEDPMDVDSKEKALFCENLQNLSRESLDEYRDLIYNLQSLFDPKEADDVTAYLETCRQLRLHDVADLKILFDYDNDVPLTVAGFTYACILSIHTNRGRFMEDLLSDKCDALCNMLFDMVYLLLDFKNLWSSSAICHLIEKNVYSLFRDIIVTGKESSLLDHPRKHSYLERVLSLIISCNSSRISPEYSFSSQILTVSFLWMFHPHLLKVFATRDTMTYYIGEISIAARELLGNDSLSSILANLLEAVADSISDDLCLARVFAPVATHLLRFIPPLRSAGGEFGESVLLRRQIAAAMNHRFLRELTDTLVKDDTSVGSVCAFLQAAFHFLCVREPGNAIAHTTQLIPVLWKNMKRCHEDNEWSLFNSRYTTGEAPGWILALCIFCPIYTSKITNMDLEQFQKFQLQYDFITLISILKMALWNLLWLDRNALPDLAIPTENVQCLEKRPLRLIRHSVAVASSDLLSQLLEWNCRLAHLIEPSNFVVDVVSEDFIQQVKQRKYRAHQILNNIPCLIPFTTRAILYDEKLKAEKVDFGLDAKHITVRRGYIVDDALDSLKLFSTQDFHKKLRVKFVNQHNMEEEGEDAGGLFKEFIEHFTEEAFGEKKWFKRNLDGQLYPNPDATDPEDLENYRIFGSIIGKAMYEKVLVDIPFSFYLLRNLKRKSSVFNDLQSIDKLLYDGLLHYKNGEVADSGLAFQIANGNDLIEMIPGGKDIFLTTENVNAYALLAAKLYISQVFQQSSHFRMGFQSLIPNHWINMFDESELQVLISGSAKGFDVEDLKNNATYYIPDTDHNVLDVFRDVLHVMFWKVLYTFDANERTLFLKYVTGCSRAPILGFKDLEYPFCLASYVDATPEHYPKAQTCFNMLYVPPYESEDQMRLKLLEAISAEAGFDHQ